MSHCIRNLRKWEQSPLLKVGKKVMVWRAVEKRPSVPRFAGPSGHLTLSAAWQEVAPYSSRRRPAISQTPWRDKKL